MRGVGSLLCARATHTRIPIAVRKPATRTAAARPPCPVATKAITTPTAAAENKAKNARKKPRMVLGSVCCLVSCARVTVGIIMSKWPKESQISDGDGCSGPKRRVDSLTMARQRGAHGMPWLQLNILLATAKVHGADKPVTRWSTAKALAGAITTATRVGEFVAMWAIAKDQLG